MSINLAGGSDDGILPPPQPRIDFTLAGMHITYVWQLLLLVVWVVAIAVALHALFGAALRRVTAVPGPAGDDTPESTDTASTAANVEADAYRTDHLHTNTTPTGRTAR